MNVRAAEIVFVCADLAAALQFLCDQLGFRVDAIRPADDPRTALVSGFGLRLRIERGADTPLTLRLVCRDPASVAGGATEIAGPGGLRVVLVADQSPLALPVAGDAPLARFTVTRAGAAWRPGRADMAYRDLVPDRQGGRFIASHIRISAGGPVPDYVHYHDIRFQLIYCARGWVELVYEDQGPPFVLAAGDCVLQPPRIRHRVLACSPGLEVIELGSPADHETFADHDRALPTAEVRPDRVFSGQRFVHHRASAATWQPWRVPGFTARDLGIADGTDRLVTAEVVRPADPAPSSPLGHGGELLFAFVLAGELTLRADGDHRLGRDDSFVLPPGGDHRLVDCSADLELFVATVGGD